MRVVLIVSWVCTLVVPYAVEAFTTLSTQQCGSKQTILFADKMSSSSTSGNDEGIKSKSVKGGGGGGGFFQAVGNFFEELDAFIDDASARRLGNGAAFYGKRKSSFYGKEDKMKKSDRNTADPLEDYQGPTSSGFFKWMPDEDGQMRPVTRMKNRVLERSEGYWEKEYAKEESKSER